jgi:fucose 4-O-acetylase-like acetyltransferase
MEMTNDREKLPDILRGFDIILVVLGHCIQDGSGVDFSTNALYFSDKLYQLIYSFHMPLFMMVSGYLAWGSVNKANDRAARKALIARRAQSLLIPIFFWTAIDYIRILVTNYINGSPQPEAIVFVYFYNALNNLWFLWAVWWCFLIVYIVHYFMKDRWAVYAIIFLALFVIPDGLGLGAYKYMLPYFVLPYYIHGFLEKHSFMKNYKLVFPILMIIYIGLFSLYNEESFIYLTGYKLIGKDVAHQLYLDLYRMIIGFVGSGVVILAWKFITQHTKYEFKLLQQLGKASMGIYILSGYIIVFAVQKLEFIEARSYLMNIIEAVVVLAISAMLVEVLVRIPYIRKIVGK